MQIIFFRLTFRSLRERQRGRLALRALKYFWIKSLAKFCQNFQELKFLCHFKNFFNVSTLYKILLIYKMTDVESPTPQV